MQFDSFAFVGLLAVCLILFHLGPRRGRLALLLACSAVFYAAWSLPFLALVLGVALVAWVGGLRIEGAGAGPRAKGWLAACTVLTLGALAAFKYGQLLLDTLHVLPGVTWLPAQLPGGVLLPLAISFYTFQALGYLADVYRGEQRACRSFPRLLLFVLFFPQLVAGPIERAGRLLPQIEGLAVIRVGGERFRAGLLLLLWGLFQKCALADNLALLVDGVYAQPSAHGPGPQLLATAAFTLQLYFDFAGYTAVARGAARMMGVELVPNFRQPFLAANPADLWRRWHISLSEWFRDYVYRPLGGNRGGRFFTLRNLLITMLVAGLWHGAHPRFAVWGLLHGLLLVAHRLLRPWLARWVGERPGPAFRLAGILITFGLWGLSLVLFRAASLGDAWWIYRCLAGGLVGALSHPAGLLWPPMLAMVGLLGLVLGAMALEEHWGLWSGWARTTRGSAALLAMFLLGIALLTPAAGPGFIYFQF